MSYILDALNRSEKERTEKLSEEFRFSIKGNVSSKTSLRKLTLGATTLIAINCALVYFIFGQKFLEPRSLSSIQNLEAKTKLTVPDNEPEEQGSFYFPETIREVSEPSRSEEIIAPPFNSLPTEFKRNIPAFEISSHIYSSDKKLRLIKVDTITYYEGDYIKQDLKLERITKEGVILAFSEGLFSLEITDSWNL